MGQYEVLDFLRNKRKEGKEWFTARDIQEALKKKKYSYGVQKGVYDDVYKLVAFGQIQYKGEGVWNHKKLFRAYKH